MNDKLFATIATTIYILLIVVSVFVISNFKFNHQKSIHYISKRGGEAITVSIASKPKAVAHTTKRLHHKERLHHKKKLHSKKKIHHKVKRKVRKKRVVKKHKVIKIKTKQKVTKEKVSKKYARKKPKIETKKLFSSIKSNSNIEKASKDKKPKGEGRGVLNRYLASIEKRLRGWPAQSNFAGEEIDVRLKIYPSGQFDYKVMRYSDNQAFNDALISYLEQLRRYGFDPHKGNRAYEIEVKFIAHQ